MRIVLDLQGVQTDSGLRGIGNYCLSLTKFFVKNSKDHEIIIALNGFYPHTIQPVRDALDDLLPQENIRVWYAPGPTFEAEINHAWPRYQTAELIRESFIRSLKPDFIQIMSFFEGYVDDAVTSIRHLSEIAPVGVILYDLIPLADAENFLKPDPVYQACYMRQIKDLENASLLLSISNYSRKQGIELLDVPEEKIVNISTGLDVDFKVLLLNEEQLNELSEKYDLSKEYILYTGRTDERKNVRRLVKAYSQLTPELRKRYNLVIVGKIDDQQKRPLLEFSKECGLDKADLIFTGFVDKSDLIKLYNACSLFIFPSLQEGFGLPALEAMASGAPVLASNTTSLPEVMGEERKHAMFDPYSVDDIHDKMQVILTNKKIREELVSEGTKQAKKFSWETSAIHAVEAIEKCVKALPDNGKAPQKNIDAKEYREDLISKISNLDLKNTDDKDLTNISRCIAHNHPDQNPQHKIFVDISELVLRDARSGIQRVVRSILHVLLGKPPTGYEVMPVYADMSTLGYKHAANFTLKFLGKPEQEGLIDEEISYRRGDLFIGLDLQHHVVSLQRAIYEQMRNDGVQVKFVVYDLLPILKPECFMADVASFHELWLDIVAKSDGAICISKAVADELDTWIEDRKIKKSHRFENSWFHLGADIEPSISLQGMPTDSKKILDVIKSRTSFLMVATVEPRKGHGVTLEAIEKLWADGIDVNLIIVGQEGWNVESLTQKIKKHKELGKRLFWLKGISDEYLEEVYASCSGLISASEGEGFGLPLIEAAQKQLPILARDIPVFREVAGKHAFYFDASTSDKLANSLCEWTKLFEMNKHPKSDNMPWLTWKESTAQLLKSFNICYQSE